MLEIFEKELKSYFHSMIAYLFLAMFWLAAAVYFTVYCLSYGIMDFGGYVLASITVVFVVIVPILTMRLMADERKQKTDQLLITCPIKASSVILGKYLAVLALFGIGLLGVFGYAVILSFFGDMVWKLTITSFVGFFLMGASFLALGTYISCCTDNQAVSASISFGVILLCFFIPNVASFNKTFAAVVEWVSLLDRYDNFINGIFDVSSIIYYLSFIAVFLFLSMRATEKRRWN